MVFDIVAIGASLGGLHAVRTLLSGIPSDFPLPIAIVQHRGSDSDGTLCILLGEAAHLEVREAEDKEPVLPGRVYIAPANYHLLVDRTAFELSVDEKVLSARPSIDVLLDSVADFHGNRAIAVILTGASADGARGAARIKSRGGFLIVQDPGTAECRVMPDAALAATAADEVVPIEQIAPILLRLSTTPNEPNEETVHE